MKVLSVEMFTKHRASAIINFCNGSLLLDNNVQYIAGRYHDIFEELDEDDIDAFVKVDKLMSEEKQEDILAIICLVVMIACFIWWLLTPPTPTIYKSTSTDKCVYVITGDGEKTTCDYIKQGDSYDLVWVE